MSRRLDTTRITWNFADIARSLCAIGDLEKMYIPPALALSESIATNQILYEESIAEELQLPPNARILDLGCGRGRVAAHIARITGARVVGVNIDQDQIANAHAFNTECELMNDFIRADFNDLPLPLPSNHFDGFYQIQAFSLAKDHTKLLQEVYRVLKPGARVSMLDWASLEAYDSQDPEHERLMQKIKPLIGAVGTPTPKSMQDALETAGFRMIRMNNASIDGLQAPLIERVDGFFRTAKRTILGLVRIGILPGHFKTLFERLTQDCDAFVKADRARLITTSYHWLAEKPIAVPKLSPLASNQGSILESPSSSQRTLPYQSTTNSS